MALQFQHVFAGKGIGPWEVECDALIDLLTVAVMEGAVVGIAGFGDVPQNALGNSGGLASGDANGSSRPRSD
jgi:hypothetical protein